MSRLLARLSLPLLLCAIAPASADTLLIERAQAASTALPPRGLSMAQVEARFGTPVQKLEPRGGQKRQWPTIHRWQYPAFTVYFEKDRVIDAVLNKASPNEIGPRPAIR